MGISDGRITEKGEGLILGGFDTFAIGGDARYRRAEIVVLLPVSMATSSGSAGT
jgi:uncharacterized membrane protein